MSSSACSSKASDVGRPSHFTLVQRFSARRNAARAADDAMPRGALDVNEKGTAAYPAHVTPAPDTTHPRASDSHSSFSGSHVDFWQ